VHCPFASPNELVSNGQQNYTSFKLVSKHQYFESNAPKYWYSWIIMKLLFTHKTAQHDCEEGLSLMRQSITATQNRKTKSQKVEIFAIPTHKHTKKRGNPQPKIENKKNKN